MSSRAWFAVDSSQHLLEKKFTLAVLAFIVPKP